MGPIIVEHTLSGMLCPELREDPPPRKMYERTDWEAVGKEIQETLQPQALIETIPQLEQSVEHLINTTTNFPARVQGRALGERAHPSQAARQTRCR
jgi:hypothetical protein